MGVTVLIDPMSYQYLTGAEIDYRKGWKDLSLLSAIRMLLPLVVAVRHFRYNSGMIIRPLFIGGSTLGGEK